MFAARAANTTISMRPYVHVYLGHFGSEIFLHWLAGNRCLPHVQQTSKNYIIARPDGTYYKHYFHYKRIFENHYQSIAGQRYFELL